MIDEDFRFDVKFQYGTGNFIFSLYASSGLVEAVVVFFVSVGVCIFPFLIYGVGEFPAPYRIFQEEMGRWNLCCIFYPGCWTDLLPDLGKVPAPCMLPVKDRTAPWFMCYIPGKGRSSGRQLSSSPCFTCSIKLQVTSGLLEPLAAQNKPEAQQNNSF